MKVLFDHQIYVEQDFGGISRYFFELGTHLKNLNINVDQSLKYSNNTFTKSDLYNSNSFFPKLKFKGKKRLMKFIDQAYSIKKLDTDFDIFHPTYYDSYFLEKLKKPFVITFYDLIHEKFHAKFHHFNTDESLFTRRQQLLDRAAKVIAISNSTKNDLLQYYKIEESKVKVVHLASSMQTETSPIQLPFANYILYVGNRDVYKNFKVFIKAITPLLQKETFLKVVCAGGGNFNDDELALFVSLNISGQVLYEIIDDNTLANLYKNAVFFIFPSLYEGFGLPILEAFSCSCPVIASNVSSLPEVAGDGALYINPESEDDILDKTSQLYYSTSLKQELVKKGLERIKHFSWEKTAEKHADIYKSII